MKSVYKYQFRNDGPGDIVRIRMPVGAKILAIQHQTGTDYRTATLWAVVDVNEVETEEREIRFHRTGGQLPFDLPPNSSTVQFLPDLVLHFFWY